MDYGDDLSVPITCSHCGLGTALGVAWLRTDPDSVECSWCKRTFAPDIDELLDAIDFAERELRLFTGLILGTPDDGGAAV